MWLSLDKMILVTKRRVGEGSRLDIFFEVVLLLGVTKKGNSENAVKFDQLHVLCLPVSCYSTDGQRE